MGSSLCDAICTAPRPDLLKLQIEEFSRLESIRVIETAAVRHGSSKEILGATRDGRKSTLMQVNCPASSMPGDPVNDFQKNWLREMHAPRQQHRRRDRFHCIYSLATKYCRDCCCEYVTTRTGVLRFRSVNKILFTIARIPQDSSCKYVPLAIASAQMLLGSHRKRLREDLHGKACEWTKLN